MISCAAKNYEILRRKAPGYGILMPKMRSKKKEKTVKSGFINKILEDVDESITNLWGFCKG